MIKLNWSLNKSVLPSLRDKVFQACSVTARLFVISMLHSECVYVLYNSPCVYVQISETELQLWRGLVAQCLAQYSSPTCSKPNHKKLVWIVSRRTAQNLHSSYCSAPELPTIPEDLWSERYTVDLHTNKFILFTALGSRKVL